MEGALGRAWSAQSDGELHAAYAPLHRAEHLCGRNCQPNGAAHFRSDSSDRSEPLGTRSIEGFEATGVRRTRTGSAAPNGTVVLTTEIWYSQQLQELLELRQTLEPETQPGEGALPDFKLTQIRRGEPDETLFYPPEGYTIDPES